MRIVALLAVRNEGLYLARCLRHLREQRLETIVIDNQSTDASPEIARSFLGKGVSAVTTLPYAGFFDLVGQLACKERLAAAAGADWYLHMDADEIREPPAPFSTLRQAIERADAGGYNAVNFDEFVFVPSGDGDDFTRSDYVAAMRHYYFFEPEPRYRVNAWKNLGIPVDLVSSGGHSVAFDGRRVYPANFILRHYIVLGREHAITKYSRERVYSRQEHLERGWHGWRMTFRPEHLRFPARERLKHLDVHGWDRSDPWPAHGFIRTTDP